MIIFERMLRLRFVSADREEILFKMIRSGVELTDITVIDFLTAEISIRKREFKTAKIILDRNSCSYQIMNQKGLLFLTQKFLFRPVLLCGILLFLMFLILTSGRIYFVKVTGNHRISAEEILAQAQMCGVKFGVKAAKVKSEEVKNTLLSSIPQLQWLGITTSGSVATIHVKERSAVEETATKDKQIFGIHASRDGIVSQITVEQGTPLVQVGQRVKTGDLLVSGYTDCGIKLRAEKPIAEVFAYTIRELNLFAPSTALIRGKNTYEHSCYMLRIGKKVINFCNHSGIPDATCVKMYEEDYWTLPGGFQLPVCVIHVTQKAYGIGSAVTSDDAVYWLPQYARSYLNNQMIAGKILDESLSWNISDDVSVMTGSYACYEMIGQVKNEEILENNAEDN